MPNKAISEGLGSAEPNHSPASKWLLTLATCVQSVDLWISAVWSVIASEKVESKRLMQTLGERDREARKFRLKALECKRLKERRTEEACAWREEVDRKDAELRRSYQEILDLKRELETPQNARLTWYRREWRVEKSRTEKAEKARENEHKKYLDKCRENETLKKTLSVRNGNGERVEPVIWLGSPHVGNVTVVNHATNILRPAMLAYMTANLTPVNLRYIKSELDASLDLDPHAPQTFEKVLDITGDSIGASLKTRLSFDYVAKHHLKDLRLARDLYDIRKGRGEGAHPPPEGLQAQSVIDFVGLASKVLSEIGEEEEAAKVKLLARSVRELPEPVHPLSVGERKLLRFFLRHVA